MSNCTIRHAKHTKYNTIGRSSSGLYINQTGASIVTPKETNEWISTTYVAIHLKSWSSTHK